MRPIYLRSFAALTKHGKTLSRKMKLEFIKRWKDAPDGTEERELLMQEFEPKGSSKKEILSAIKDFCGKMKNAEKQKKSGEKAKEQGFDWKKNCEKGTIKISVLNQQLQTIDPPADRAVRSQALKIVQQHLNPYLKHYKIKLSERQISRFRKRLVEELIKDRYDRLTEMKIKNNSDTDISGIVEKLESFIPHAQKYMGYTGHPDLNFVSDPKKWGKYTGENCLLRTGRPADYHLCRWKTSKRYVTIHLSRIGSSSSKL